jgi:hypothetical protein
VAIGLGLTLINVLQGGLDPATDALEVGEVAGTAAEDTAVTADRAATAARAAASCGGESFSADTKVLLATGAAVPIASQHEALKALNKCKKPEPAG